MVKLAAGTYIGTGTKYVTPFSEFKSGMYYTTKELDDGLARALVNFKQTSDGSALTQRQGLNRVANFEHRVQLIHRFQNDPREFILTSSADGEIITVFADGQYVPTEFGNLNGFRLDDEGYMQWAPYPPNDSIVILGKAGLYQMYYKKNEGVLHVDYMEPYEVDPSRAVVNGFNLYDDDPVNFEDDLSALTHGVTAIFAYRKDESKPRQLGNIVMEGTRGEELHFKAYYKKPADKLIKIKWEYKATSSNTWEVKQNWVDISTNNHDILSFIPNDDSFALRVTVAEPEVKPEDAGEDWKPNEYGIEEATVKALVYPVFEVTQKGKEFDVEFTTDLRKAEHILYYNRQLILYGKETGEPNTLFFSEFEDMTYFPYPNKSISFDNPIVHVHVFHDDLIVFTTAGIYLCGDSIIPEEMKVYTLKTDLTITHFDKKTVRTIGKNLYFTVGTEHYIGIPSKYLTTKDNLQITKISDPIEFLFQPSQLQAFMKLRLHDFENLPEDDDIVNESHQLIRKFSYLDRDLVKTYWHYQVTINDTTYPYTLVVVYNNTLRSWVLEDFTRLEPYFLYREHINDPILMVHAQGISRYHEDNATDEGQPIHLYLDTGNRNLDPIRKKRFSRFSLHMNNHGDMELGVKSEFKLDGVSRQTFREQRAIWYTDPAHPRYGEIDYVNIDEPNLLVPGLLEFPEGKLKFSHFVDVDRIKVNQRISGIGYLPQMILKLEAGRPFEILGYSLAYKAKKAK